MFTVEMLPAEQGDALWIEYGTKTEVHRILVDGGTPPTADVLEARLARLGPAERRFELLVVSHIDTDHIGGILRFLDRPPAGLTFDDVWFNGWPQLEPLVADQPLGEGPGVTGEAILGPVDGEILDRLLDLRPGDLAAAHNGAFDGAAAMIPARGPLPSVTLPGGMRLTLLAPDRQRLRRLRSEWVDVIREAGRTEEQVAALVAEGARRRGVDLTLGPGQPDVRASAAARFASDRSPSNGSSIVVLAEFDGRSLLLTGDAFAPVIAAGVARLLAERGEERLRLDAVKLAHHGSRNNTSLPLLELLDCRRFLISTSGALFCHPDVEAVSRVLVTNGPGVELGFGYRTDTTAVWGDRSLQLDPEFAFTTRYPSTEETGLRTSL